MSDRFGNDFYSHRATLNFCRTASASRVKIKLLYHTKLLLKLRTLDNKSQNILATKTALNFSGPYSRIRPAKLTNHSMY